MPLISVLSISNRWDTVFSQASWDDVDRVHSQVRSVIERFTGGANATLDLGNVIMARFQDEAVSQDERIPRPEDLPAGLEIATGLFQSDTPPDVDFVRKCLDMAPFLQNAVYGAGQMSESTPGNNRINAMVLVERPASGINSDLEILTDSGESGDSVNSVESWLDGAMKTPESGGVRLSANAAVFWSALDSALKHAIEAAREMHLRVSLAVGGPGCHPAMLWRTAAGLAAYQRQVLPEKGSFDWVLVKGLWDPDMVLSRRVPSAMGDYAVTMRPYVVTGGDVGTLDWFLSLAEEVSGRDSWREMPAGMRYGSAVARQALQLLDIPWQQHGTGPDGYVMQNGARVTPVFDIVEYLDLKECCKKTGRMDEEGRSDSH